MYSKDTIKLIDSIPVVRFFPQAEKNGSAYHCKCPECGEEGKRKGKIRGLQFKVDTVKGINSAKCWQCNFSLRGAINTYAYLHNLDTHSDFSRIIKDIAEQQNLNIQEEEETRPAENLDRQRPIPGSFAYQQLLESGLTPEDVKVTVRDKDSIRQVSPFKKGSIDVITGKVDELANEMLIYYFDLEGRPKTYIPVGFKSKELPYIRVRWSNPEAHEGRDGKPIKYQTLAGAKASLYIPEKIRVAYKSGAQIDTLFVQEGEKKAEKACKHGIPSIAIPGIMQFGNKKDGLPLELQYLVSKCGIKNIVLMFDSDWNNLSKSIDIDDDIDKRPRQFAKAAIRFKKFTKTLHQSKLFVDIWFGHVNENEASDKGIDDLLVNTLKDSEDLLAEDIKAAMLAHDGIGKYVTVNNISTSSDYQILDFWNLNSKEDFFKTHYDRIITLKSFRFDKIFYNVIDGEIKQAREFGSGSDFWEITYDEKGERKIKMSVIDTLDFLAANGFRSHVDEEDNNTFVRIDQGVIYKTRVPEIQRFVYNYVQKSTKDKDIYEYFAENIDKKLSQSKLNLLESLVTMAGIPEQYSQNIFYRNSQVAISDEGISVKPLVGPVWEQNLIDRHFKRIKIFNNIEKLPDGSFDYSLTPEGEKCEFLRFLINTSTFTDLNTNDPEVFESFMVKHLINKITCIGYMLRDFRPPIESKAVVSMDARLSEVGASNGRSGKSLIGVALSKMIQQVTVPGRKVESADSFIFTEVRNVTRNIFIDDIKVNFDIGDIYSEISGDMTVNVKQGKRFSIPYELAPKIYITTNHAIKSEGDSTEDRVVFMAFSQYYTKQFTPAMDFGHQFFSQWDDLQWQLFDNLMIECIFYYMKSIAQGWTKAGCGAVDPPLEQINLRRERQFMGEAFLQWAESYFAEGGNNIEARIHRHQMFQDFHKEFPGNMKYITANKFKKALKAFCQYKGLHLNPHRPHEETGQCFADWISKNPGETFIGSDEKTQGKEYITISTGKHHY